MNLIKMVRSTTIGIIKEETTMAKTIRDELKDKFFKLGGTQEEVPNDLTIRSNLETE